MGWIEVITVIVVCISLAAGIAYRCGEKASDIKHAKDEEGLIEKTD